VSTAQRDDRSTDAALLREVVSGFLAERSSPRQTKEISEAGLPPDRDLYRELASLGLLTMLVDTTGDGRVGPAPANLPELAVLAQLTGQSALHGPALACNVAAYAIAAGEASDLHRAQVQAITDGTVIATVAPAGELTPGEAGDLRATEVDGGYELSGSMALAEAVGTDLIVASAHTAAGPELFTLDTRGPGVSATPLASLDLGRRYAAIRLERAAVTADRRLVFEAGASAFGETLWWLGSLLACHEMLGAAVRAHELTVEYARSRVAFGRAIGSFQSIKHRLVDMRLRLETGRALAEIATDDFCSGQANNESLSVAKAYLNEYGPLLVRQCLQIHGGIGFTWEHDLHLYLRRVEANALLYGDTGFHCDRIVQALEDSRSVSAGLASRTAERR
jgi:alkylation response protein AidB-like acyl-CoA dehydrogenase